MKVKEPFQPCLRRLRRIREFAGLCSGRPAERNRQPCCTRLLISQGCRHFAGTRRPEVAACTLVPLKPCCRAVKTRATIGSIVFGVAKAPPSRQLILPTVSTPSIGPAHA